METKKRYTTRVILSRLFQVMNHLLPFIALAVFFAVLGFVTTVTIDCRFPPQEYQDLEADLLQMLKHLFQPSSPLIQPATNLLSTVNSQEWMRLKEHYLLTHT